MKAHEILRSTYDRFGEPDLTNFSLSDLDGRQEYTFGAFLLADHDGSVVLIRRTPIRQYPGIENYWWIPGGAREQDEQLDQTAVREFREETGLNVTVQRTLLAELARDRPFIAVIFRGGVVAGAVSGGGDPDNITAEAKTFAPHEIGMEHLWMHTDKILLAKEGFVIGSVDDLILKNGLKKQTHASLLRCSRHETAMNESVIYALRSGDRILCEWRDFDGTRQNCIPGGGVEPCDRQQEDYVLAAVRREVQEELGITPEHCRRLDTFASNGVRFHIVLIDGWAGTLPAVNRDNQNKLRWVPLNTLVPSITLEPLKRIIGELENTGL